MQCKETMQESFVIEGPFGTKSEYKRILTGMRDISTFRKIVLPSSFGLFSAQSTFWLAKNEMNVWIDVQKPILLVRETIVSWQPISNRRNQYRVNSGQKKRGTRKSFNRNVTWAQKQLPNITFHFPPTKLMSSRLRCASNCNDLTDHPRKREKWRIYFFFGKEQKLPEIESSLEQARAGFISPCRRRLLNLACLCHGHLNA